MENLDKKKEWDGPQKYAFCFFVCTMWAKARENKNETKKDFRMIFAYFIIIIIFFW
jgi:hypothetical protein